MTVPSKFLSQTLVFQILLGRDKSHDQCHYPIPPEQQSKEKEEEGIQEYLFVTADMDTFN